jgi:hypothetical protein
MSTFLYISLGLFEVPLQCQSFVSRDISPLGGNGVAHPADNYFLSIIISLYNAASTLLYEWVQLEELLGKHPNRLL